MGFFDRFESLCKLQGVTVNSVAKQLNIPSGSVTAWKNGTEPRLSTTKKIAEHFDVSTDYLLGNEQKNKPLSVQSERSLEFAALFEQLPKDKQDFFIDLIKRSAE